MEIGLLNAFTPTEERDTGCFQKPAFSIFLRNVEPDWTLREYRVTEGELPATADACGAYLLTGSPQGVYDGHPWIDSLVAFICDAFVAGRPMIGICFGHQLLAHALGGRAEKAAGGWGLGLETVDMKAGPDWLFPSQDNINLHFCHQDQVTVLPPKAVRLGGSTRCPHAIFAIENRVLGIQGHPEFTPKFMAGLVEQMRPKVGDELADRAASGLAAARPDNDILARWIVNFLNKSPM